MAALRVLFDLAALVVWIAVLVKVAQRPASKWNHGWGGKIGSILVVLFFYSVIGGWWVPWGAVIVWWRRFGRRREDFELPMADGRKRR